MSPQRLHTQFPFLNLFISEQLKKMVIHYKRMGYNMNILRQTARMVVNIRVFVDDNFASLF